MTEDEKRVLRKLLEKIFEGSVEDKSYMLGYIECLADDHKQLQKEGA